MKVKVRQEYRPAADLLIRLCTYSAFPVVNVKFPPLLIGGDIIRAF